MVPSFKQDKWALICGCSSKQSRTEQSIPRRDIQAPKCAKVWDGGYWDSASASHAPLDKKLLCIRLCRLNEIGTAVELCFFLDQGIHTYVRTYVHGIWEDCNCNVGTKGSNNSEARCKTRFQKTPAAFLFLSLNLFIQSYNFAPSHERISMEPLSTWAANLANLLTVQTDRELPTQLPWQQN